MRNARQSSGRKVVGRQFGLLEKSMASNVLQRRPIPFWKRFLDISIALPTLVILSPLFLLIAGWIRAVSSGPVFFCQIRLGEMGQPFTIYKFRTMHGNDRDLATSSHRDYIAGLTTKNQAVAKPDLKSKLIRGGEFLRSHSLDELPQLVNVLIGNMSLVGPRPEVLNWEDYPDWQRKRFEVTPGISGLWQVSGKNNLSFNEMIELDIKYVEQRSLGLDAWIMAKTLGVVFTKSNS